MKTITLSLLLLGFLPGLLFAQQKSTDQNPNAYESYQVYRQKLDGHEKTMSSTIDLTYQAYDPILEKKQKREDRRDFRRELRLERARNRFNVIPYDPFGPFPRRRW
jgi:hypothetical protein